MANILIIGGGITGVATAHAAASLGATVRLLEARRLGALASGWTLGGVRQSGRDPAEMDLARRAVAIWPGLAEVLEADVGYHQRGNLRLARTPSEVTRIQALVSDQNALGLDLRFLADNAAIRAIAPAIGKTVLAASYCPTDGHADPNRTVAAFAAAARRLGADIQEDTPCRRILLSGSKVTAVETDHGVIEADRIVLAAGFHSPELLAPLGLTLPIDAQIVSVLQTVPMAPLLDPVFGVANADCAGRQEADGRLRVTTGISAWPHPVAGWREAQLQPTGNQVAEMIQRISQVLPALGNTGVARVWGGLIDLTPDALPVLDGDCGIEGLIVAAGFSGHGFGIGPMVGRVLADLALGRAPETSVGAFRLNRFTNRVAGQAPLTLHG